MRGDEGSMRTMDDHTIDDAVGAEGEAAELVAVWSQLPYPFESAVMGEVNDARPASRRAAELIHRVPPGETGTGRPVWVLTRLAPSAEGDRMEVVGWCWYMTRGAAEAADDTVRGKPGVSVLHETVVPRTVRCEQVEEYIARRYRTAPAHLGV